MTRPAPTNSASSTSPPATRTATSSSTWCGARRRPASCRSPSAAACARSRTSARCCSSGADKVSINTAAVNRRALRQGGGGEIRRPVHRGRDRRQEGVEAGRDGALGNLHPWRAQSDRHRRGRLCQGSGGARRRRNPAHLDGPRRHQARLRHRAHPRDGGRGAGAGDRLRRGRHARAPGRGHPRRPCHRGAGRLDLPLRRAQRARGQGSTWRKPGCRCGSIRDKGRRKGRP